MGLPVELGWAHEAHILQDGSIDWWDGFTAYEPPVVNLALVLGTLRVNFASLRLFEASGGLTTVLGAFMSLEECFVIWVLRVELSSQRRAGCRTSAHSPDFRYR